MESLPGAQLPAAIPDDLKGWNWGAFLMNWMWAIDNRTWIGLLALVPYAGFIMAIVLGVKGNEWAWKNRPWDGVDHFRRVQKRWTYWGVGLTIAAIALGFFAAVVILLLSLGSFPGPE